MSLWSRVKDWFGSDAAQLKEDPHPRLPRRDRGDAERVLTYACGSPTCSSSAIKSGCATITPPCMRPSSCGTATTEVAEFTRTARPPEGMLPSGILGDFSLTPLLPFNGGTVGLQGALTVVKGENPATGARRAACLLKLVGPPLAEALGITRGLQRTRAAADLGAAEIQLGVHREFAAAAGRVEGAAPATMG